MFWRSYTYSQKIYNLLDTHCCTVINFHILTHVHPATVANSRVDFDGMSTIHYSGAIMGAMASQITGVSIVCAIVCSDADQRKHQSPASLVFVRGIHRWPVAQMASNAENDLIWWRHHVPLLTGVLPSLRKICPPFGYEYIQIGTPI